MAGYSWQHFYYRDLSINKSNQTENLGEKGGWTYSDEEGRYIKIIVTRLHGRIIWSLSLDV